MGQRTYATLPPVTYNFSTFSFKWNLLVFYWWCMLLFERKAVTITECGFLFLLILLGNNSNIFRVYKGMGLCIHCEKSFIIGFINTFITSDNLFGRWECKFHFMQILLYNTLSSTLGSNLIWTLDFQTYNAKFIPFYQLLPIPPTTPLATLGKHHSTLLLWVQHFFFNLHKSDTIQYLSFFDLFYLT